VPVDVPAAMPSAMRSTRRPSSRLGDDAVELVVARHRLGFGPHRGAAVFRRDLHDAVLRRQDDVAALDPVAQLERPHLAVRAADERMAPQRGDDSLGSLGDRGHGRALFCKRHKCETERNGVRPTYLLFIVSGA
jgi:hypothetical protein